MKDRLQLSPAMSAAAVCALLWFALWLAVFRPARPQTALRPPASPASFLPAGVNSMREIRSPSLFALPSKQGFSVTFPEPRVDLFMPSADPDSSNLLSELDTAALALSENQHDYLAREQAKRGVPDQISLQEAMPQLKEDLPVPGKRPATVIPPPKRIALFFSPELQARTDSPPTLTVSGTLPPSVRIYVGIQPAGTVDQVLFDTPVENPELAVAVRQMHFKPASRRTDSWFDLRFTPEGNS